MRIILVASALLISMVTGMAWGILVHKKEVFPHPQIKFVWDKLSGNDERYHYGPWSIGIYTGAEPLSVVDSSEEFSNPVLTAKDVTDIDAVFVADPFIVQKDGGYLMFFEVLNRDTNLGSISYAKSSDGVSWKYKETIIEENFHLSYPQVFEHEGEYYLVPESYQDRSVRLYRAVDFPHDWEYVGSLLTGYSYIDPTLFQKDEKWWMYVSTPDNATLNLYYSSNLESGWSPHPENPIIKGNKRHARMSGPVFQNNGNLYRFTQSAVGGYGTEVFGFEVKELTTESYSETLFSEQPLITGSGVNGWNSDGMHHLDLHELSDSWIAAVDGRFY